MQKLFHSIRLFSKGTGAKNYVLTGVAARCDWIALSDAMEPHTHLVRRVDTNRPRHIFLSLRSPTHALAWFANEVLPQIQAPFVLVSGSEDVTIPEQIDKRWRSYSDIDIAAITRIRDHRLLRAWFAENLATEDPLIQPIPTGLVFTDSSEPPLVDNNPPPLADRPLRVLCAHRAREGEQWELRRQISETAKTHWSGICTHIDAEVPQQEFFQLCQNHAFVICASGGGLDPSPKAFHAILNGAIPIIQNSPIVSAYRQLPVAVTPDWTPEALSLKRLESWRADLLEEFDVPARRKEVIRRLGLDYWWRQIEAAANPPDTELKSTIVGLQP